VEKNCTRVINKKFAVCHLNFRHLNKIRVKGNACQVAVNETYCHTISRTAGLGTRLPWDETFVVDSYVESGLYTAFQTISHLIQVEIQPEFFTNEVWEYVFLHSSYPENCKIKPESLEKLR
jgi:leucyl-tRNA synthetase